MKSKLLFRRKLREWQTIHYPEISLNLRDWSLAEKFNSSSTKLRIEAMPIGIRITTRSWIGVVRLDSLEIRIEPKLAGDHVDVVEMLELTTGIKLLNKCANDHQLKTDADNLFDLIATLLVTEGERLLQSGLLSDYVTEESAISFVRGRILVAEQMLKRFGQVDRIHCRFDERTQDIDANRVIAAALSVCRRFVASPTLKHRINRCLSEFSECCNMDLGDSLEILSRLSYDRLNSHYRPAHKLAELVLRNYGAEEFSSAGQSSVYSFLLDMNLLFEQFIETLIVRLCRDQDIQPRFQLSDGSVIRDADTGAPFSQIRPDALLKSRISGFVVPVDAKYKRLDDTKVDNADIYQAFLYTYAFSVPAQPKQAFIFYPASLAAGKLQRLKINCKHNSSAIVTLVGIHIPTIIAELRSRKAADCILNFSQLIHSATESSHTLAVIQSVSR